MENSKDEIIDMENIQPTTPIATKEALTPITAAGKYAESMTSEPPSYTSRVSSPATQRRSRRSSVRSRRSIVRSRWSRMRSRWSSRSSHRRSTRYNGQGIDCHVNHLFSSQLIGGFAILMPIILAFNRQLTGMGMAMNVCLFVATVLKIANAGWALAVDSDKHTTMLKWQSWFSLIITAFVCCFSGGVVTLTQTGEFFPNA